MDSKKVANDTVERMEVAEDKGKEPDVSGCPSAKAFEWGHTRKGYWRIASSPILHRTLNDNYWQRMGFEIIEVTLNFMKPPYTGPYVRWCERTEVSHLLLLDCGLWGYV